MARRFRWWILPLIHNRHTAEMIPGATLHIRPGQRHFTIVGELPALARSLSLVTRPEPFAGRVADCA